MCIILPDKLVLQKSVLVYKPDTDVASNMNIQAVDCFQDHRAALCYREGALLIKTHI